MKAEYVEGRAAQAAFLEDIFRCLPEEVRVLSPQDYLDLRSALRVFRVVSESGEVLGGGSLIFGDTPGLVGCQYFALFPNGAGRLLYAIKAVAELVFSNPAASRFAFTHLPSDTVTPRVCEIIGTQRLGPYLHYIDRGQP